MKSSIISSLLNEIEEVSTTNANHEDSLDSVTTQYNSPDSFNDVIPNGYNIDISIPTSLEVGKWIVHTEYKINFIDFHKKVSTQKRFDDFRKLDRLLKKIKKTKNINDLEFPQLPPKKFWDRMNPSFIETRREDLEVYLRKLINLPKICIIKEILVFLNADSISQLTQKILHWTMECDIESLLSKFLELISYDVEETQIRLSHPLLLQSIMQMEPKSSKIKEIICKILISMIKFEGISKLFIYNDYLKDILFWVLETYNGLDTEIGKAQKKLCLKFVRKYPVSFASLLTFQEGVELIDEFFNKKYGEKFHDFISLLFWYALDYEKVQELFHEDKPTISILLSSSQPLTLLLASLLVVTLIQSQNTYFDFLKSNSDMLFDTLSNKLRKHQLLVDSSIYSIFLSKVTLKRLEIFFKNMQSVSKCTSSFLLWCCYYILKVALNSIGILFLKENKFNTHIDSSKGSSTTNHILYRNTITKKDNLRELGKYRTNNSNSSEISNYTFPINFTLCNTFSQFFDSNSKNIHKIDQAFRFYGFHFVAFKFMKAEIPENEKIFSAYLLLWIPIKERLNSSLLTNSPFYQPIDNINDKSNQNLIPTLNSNDEDNMIVDTTLQKNNNSLNIGLNSHINSFNNKSASNSNSLISDNYKLDNNLNESQINSISPIDLHMQLVIESLFLRSSIIQSLIEYSINLLIKCKEIIDSKQGHFNLLSNQSFELKLNTEEEDILIKLALDSYSNLKLENTKLEKGVNDYLDLFKSYSTLYDGLELTFKAIKESISFIEKSFKSLNSLRKIINKQDELIQQNESAMIYERDKLDIEETNITKIIKELKKYHEDLKASITDSSKLRIEWHKIIQMLPESKTLLDNTLKEIEEKEKEYNEISSKINNIENRLIKLNNQIKQPINEIQIKSEDNKLDELIRLLLGEKSKYINKQFTIESELQKKNLEKELYDNPEALKESAAKLLSKIRSLEDEQSILNEKILDLDENKIKLKNEISLHTSLILDQDKKLYSQKQTLLISQRNFEDNSLILHNYLKDTETIMKSLIILLESLNLNEIPLNEKLTDLENILDNQKSLRITLKNEVETLTRSILSTYQKLGPDKISNDTNLSI